ncbi:ankyrin repeat-containing protein [Besnoitia besnoiti]|uniref:Ankyrin repeat-containing protein n=1 Tax=Besnoitia besnoiti TaxID=94643 RepID=A0A2A9M2A2_BESBE|nr:ankyrin repeat-containing protein [Besnoitia besnoiti]PFH32628.1 ankyrin repeat-containing protein [Besnoitia besnoiti]
MTTAELPNEEGPQGEASQLEQGAGSSREELEELIDDFIYAARVGELEEMKEALASLKMHFAEPHSLCRFLAGRESENKNKKLKKDGQCWCDSEGGKPIQVVDVPDPFSGQTALHMAAANGEEEIAKYLIVEEGVCAARYKPAVLCGAQHLPNRLGNTPLHWAVTNQRLALVKLILDSSPPPAEETASSAESSASSASAPATGRSSRAPSAAPFCVEVLAQNSVGKSALSEGFNSGNMEVLQLLLEHHSAKALEDSYQPVTAPRGDAAPDTAEDGTPTQDSGAAAAETAAETALQAAGGERASALCAADSCLVQELTHALKLDAYTKTAATTRKGCSRPREKREAGQGASEGASEGASAAAPEEAAASDSQESEGAESDGIVVKCREIGLSWTGEAFGKDAARDDTTGLHLWSAAVIGAQWMADLSNQGRFAGASVLELGAGCGLMGLAAALHSREPLAAFCQSDIFPHTLRNLERGFALNDFTKDGESWQRAGCAARAEVLALDWCDKNSWPRLEGDNEGKKGQSENFQQFDLILGSDLLYDRKMLAPLVDVVASLLKKPAGTFYYVHRLHRQGAGELVDELRRRGLKCEERSPPDEYFSNPFVDKTEAEAEVHLPEFTCRDFVMVRCAWR